MLNPEYILRISEASEKVAEDLHNRIIEAVVRRIMLRLGRGEQYMLTAKDKYQLEVLIDSGYLRADLEKEIAKKVKAQQATVKKAFEDAGVKAISYDNAVYRNAGLEALPLEKSPFLIRMLQRDYEKTLGELKNLTGTMANAAQQTFITECDKAYQDVMSGAVSYTEAVKNAVNTIASDGVVVTYPSGHKDTIETATLRAVRTSVAQACGEITTARMTELDWDIILVSAHLGARIGNEGENAGNHAWWQGKFYSKSGTDPRFPPFAVCGYGTGEGLCGYNCRHSFGPGDGEHNPYEGYDSEENKRAYLLSQKQRAMERAIRKTKRECLGLKAAADSAQDETLKQSLTQDYRDAAKRLQRQNAAYRDFCKNNNLKTMQERLSIAGWGRKEAAQATAAARAFTPEAKDDMLSAKYYRDKGYLGIPIKDEALKHIPIYKPVGWTDEKAVILQEAHKSLLQAAKNEPVGTEVSAAYSLEMRELGRRIGKTEGYTVPIPNPPVLHIAMHNHPGFTAFSSDDINIFCAHDRLTLLTAVGNDGSLYVVEKTIDYNPDEFEMAFFDFIPKLEAAENVGATEYSRTMVEFLEGAERYGVRFFSGKAR